MDSFIATEWRAGKVRPIPGNAPHARTGRPGDLFHVEGAFATIPSAPLPVSRDRMNTEAPQYAFSRQGGIYRSDVAANQNQIPGRAPTTSRWSVPSPGKRTRREDHALLIVRDEFRTGYSLIGLLASIARLRFTGTVRIALDRRPGKELSSNGNGVFSLLSHRRGSPQSCEVICVRMNFCAAVSARS